MTAQYIADADSHSTETQEDVEDIRAVEAAKADDPEGLPLDLALAEIEQERARLMQTS